MEAETHWGSKARAKGTILGDARSWTLQVVGVPDKRYGESVCAWVRLHESAVGNVTEEQIKDWCKGKISHFKIPRYIIFKKEHEFPLTVSGKVKKFEIREKSKIALGLEQRYLISYALLRVVYAHEILLEN
ncbi:hypothetical protein ANCDUO_12545 [Ancylostoma duodenale]|uniref:AMP-binding enzyme C-terminal domain-containing protein n=1 Tax=Ancylostoma duodenale TaxID=51022 RepID=A0A0C2GE96_9BILA|nr:hypothetical protein ANCDUO_12545 [Ancylostoma duodenale]